MKWIVCLLSLSLCGTVQAQEAVEDSVSCKAKAVEVSVGTDIVSQYIWRGLMLGSAGIQPAASVGWKGLCLSAWGNVGFVNRDDPYEIDFTLSYTIKGFSVGITDYWNTEGDHRYFYYKQDETGHAFEAFVGYDFGFLNVSWQTIFAGADGSNKSGNRAFSSYFELNVPFSLWTCEWVGSLGVVPYATTYYDADHFAVTNVSLRCTKEIPLGRRFKLPIFAQVTANPNAKKLYFVGGITVGI
ncbi:MAG: hypothetical protein IJQ59_09790 [Bacteroidaceae bacterium]|nr:hypothetical protein [Bacteroidaceae bacterium]